VCQIFYGFAIFDILIFMCKKYCVRCVPLKKSFSECVSDKCSFSIRHR
jgi:hypothetical protein